ncbi:MAG TPA: Fis family transcriptional regulator, partial [Syntrophobacteraceae bacterium]|nr:Fis family transcriptional regulator [Syntrophobacteraceae bacterium]
MKTLCELTAVDRCFFDLVARATFSNPFSDDRGELDLRLADCSPQVPLVERVDRAIAKVRERVGKLESSGGGDLRRYRGEDRSVLRGAFLFDVFHHYYEAFDHFIADQVRTGKDSLPVPFARDALAMLNKRGFGEFESQRFFAMFYQVRRAFYFINQGLVGHSRSMQDLRRRLWNNVFTYDSHWYERYLWNRMEDFSTLLLGETGSGKGSAAAAIGRSGFIPFDDRKGCFAESFTRSFNSINLSQYPESLIESELFGHRKGAFTGAIDHHQGILARCSPHGAILLDEIGDVSIPVQVKLLQVLQDRSFSPVGSHEILRFRGRVIAATNRPLPKLRLAGLFRDDFFYRLCSDVIVVPSFRQRLQEDREELFIMVTHVIQRILGVPASDLVRWVCAALAKGLGSNYGWPGNIRELENVI